MSGEDIKKFIPAAVIILAFGVVAYIGYSAIIFLLHNWWILVIILIIAAAYLAKVFRSLR
jgi:fatty acid desaturase